MSIFSNLLKTGYSLLILFLFSFVEAKELRTVSYNIRHGQSGERAMNLDRQVAVLKALHADLIALQEVDQCCERSGNVEQAKYFAEKLGMFYVFGEAIKLGDGKYGHAILSKYPIESSKVHKLPGKGEARIVLEVRVNHPSFGEIAFCSVHYTHEGEGGRLAQVKAFEAATKEYKLPMVITGDFNALPESQTIQHYRSNWNEAVKLGAKMTYPAMKPVQEIDYCFYRGMQSSSAETRVVDEAKASDHRPLLSVFK